MPEEIMDDQLIDEQDLQEPTEQPEAPEETYEAQPEPVEEDWRIKAMQDPRVRERFDQALLGGQEQQVYEAPADPVIQAKERLQEINSSMPQLDEKSMTAEQVTKFLNWQNDRAAAQQAVYDAELSRTQAEVQAQRARSTLEDYIGSVKTADPAFKEYENEFRKFVRENNIDPRLLENRTVVEMIRKSIGYDHVRGRRKATSPGAPPVDESYTSQGQRARARSQESRQLREPTELDHQLAAYYRMPVEDLIKSEDDLGGDAERWSMKGAVQWSDDEKLRRAGIRR